jgi:hypothetical protein
MKLYVEQSAKHVCKERIYENSHSMTDQRIDSLNFDKPNKNGSY